MDTVEAIALDDQHLELKEPLPQNIGKRFLIKILSPIVEHSDQLKQLEEAYLTMSEEERNRELDLAEEGLQLQSDLNEQFPDEEDELWWE